MFFACMCGEGEEGGGEVYVGGRCLLRIVFISFARVSNLCRFSVSVGVCLSPSSNLRISEAGSMEFDGCVVLIG